MTSGSSTTRLVASLERIDSYVSDAAQTCELSGIDPEAHLRHVLGRIADHPSTGLTNRCPGQSTLNSPTSSARNADEGNAMPRPTSDPVTTGRALLAVGSLLILMVGVLLLALRIAQQNYVMALGVVWLSREAGGLCERSGSVFAMAHRSCVEWRNLSLFCVRRRAKLA